MTGTLFASVGDCPAGCGRKRQPGHLLCRECWYQVPREIRLDVWATWRRYMRTSNDNDFEAYDQAREAAMASIR